APLGGYAYGAFGQRLIIDGVSAPTLAQPFTWQGKREIAPNLYDSRARIWSADIGAFLQPDQYAFLTRGGTLWSWPGNNPFRGRDPSGRFFDSAAAAAAEAAADAAGAAGAATAAVAGAIAALGGGG